MIAARLWLLRARGRSCLLRRVQRCGRRLQFVFFGRSERACSSSSVFFGSPSLTVFFSSALPSSSDSEPTRVRSGWSSHSTGSFGSDDGQGGTAQVHVVRGVFRFPTIATVSASGTAALPIAGARARPPARPPGWPGRQQRVLQRPRARRSGAGLARRASGLQPRQGSAAACVTRSLDRRKCLMRLRNLPIVLRLPRRPRPWRYKIS